MIREQVSLRIRDQHLLSWTCIILMISQNSWASSKELPEPASADVLFWTVLVSIGFVWGSFNGLCLLAIRRWRFQEAGDRWTNAFWLGVLWAPFTFLLTRQVFSWWGEWSWEELGGTTLSMLFLMLIIFNLSGVWMLGYWASQES